MRIIIFIAAIASLSFPAFADKEGVATIPAEAVVDVPDGNYAQARMRCVNAALKSAAKTAAIGVVPPGEAEKYKDNIESQITARGQNFVMSYKVLGEETDTEAKKITVRVQATVSLKEIRKALGLSQAKPQDKKEPAPAMLLIIEERDASYTVSGNFLAINSPAEETLAKNMRGRGYTVLTRKDMRDAGMDSVAVEAFNGSEEGRKLLAQSFYVSMFAFGKVEEAVKPARNGQIASVVFKLTVLGLDGSTIFATSKSSAGIFDNAEEGIQSTIAPIAESAAEEMDRALKPKPADSGVAPQSQEPVQPEKVLIK